MGLTQTVALLCFESVTLSARSESLNREQLVSAVIRCPDTSKDAHISDSELASSSMFDYRLAVRTGIEQD
jgi:hypothetical protein